MGLSQADRLIAVTTPLPQDVLLLTGFSGREVMSRLFTYHLEMFSQEEDIDPTKLVGQPISWLVQPAEGDARYFSGFVSRFSAGGTSRRKFRTYRAEVVPWVWFLTRASDCCIFQDKTAVEIIEAIFAKYGFDSNYDKKDLSKTYVKREYCVQYRETAFNFVSRLMEQEGIFYYFRHDKEKHTLVLADQISACKPLSSGGQVVFGTGSKGKDLLQSWEHQYELCSGAWAQQDYNFETPSTNLLSSVNTKLKVTAAKPYELYDYPGEFKDKDGGKAFTTLRMEEEESSYEVVSGSCEIHEFTPGASFTLADHEVDSEKGKSYVLTSVSHSASDYTYFNDSSPPQYSNQFTCIPDKTQFRPARITPKPLVQGPQTAVVVGPKGEEIYTDKYGRIKVQFFWDRLGKKDENSSCFIRVAESLAGKNWGAVFLPRIGHEVVVEFLEGDPDRPLVTGSVYNKDMMPPYTLPDKMTQTVLKTRSTKGGSADNFNELRFEDAKGKEDIFFHAEKDFHREVENDDDLKVGHDQTITIKNNRTEEVQEGNESVTITKGNRTVTVKQGNDSHQIKQGNREVVIEMGNDDLKIKMGNQTTKLDMGASSTEAMQSITLKVGQSSITIDQMGVTIKGMMVSIEGQIQTQVKGLITQVNADAMLKMQGAITMIN
jgi:type VI secretion system secreted protein VgrG